MDVQSLTSRLAGLPVPQIRLFDSIGSTNDEALDWAIAGGADGCLVVADQQTLGRGRLGRHWVTNPGSALAFSLILHPTPREQENFGGFSPLGALAISQALEAIPGLAPQIKWPNDVLLQRRKAAGILVEVAWLGDKIQGVVIGIGLNITREAVPPDKDLLFPAISVEQVAGRAVDRLDLLHAILRSLFAWRAKLGTEEFLRAWEQRLAFRDEPVRIEGAGTCPITGTVIGIDQAGNLLLRAENNTIINVAVGDVHLRGIE